MHHSKEGSCSNAFNSLYTKDEHNEDTYSDDSLQNNCLDMDSIRSGESIIKNYIFDNTKYNPNTQKCISFWRAIKERPELRPCPCEFVSTQSIISEKDDQGSEDIFGPCATWYDALLELQKRKMDQVAFAATFQSCRLCERDEPYQKFKRKMGQNYSDSELNDYEDLTCLNCWTSYSKKKAEEAEAEAAKKVDDDDTRIIYMNSCACQDTKCTCSKDWKNSSVTEASDQDISNPEVIYVSQTVNPTDIYSEIGEGDSQIINPRAGNITSCSKGKESLSTNLYNLRKFQKMENPSGEPSTVILEEVEFEQEIESCDCRSCDLSLCGDVKKRSNNPPLEDDDSSMSFYDEDPSLQSQLSVDQERGFSSHKDPSLGTSAPVPSKTPANMMHSKYKPGCCYGCGILGCVCNKCPPVTPKQSKKDNANKAAMPKKIKIENFDKFLNQCEQCGQDCKCWTNKVDHAKQYLEDLKQILKKNVTYDKACGDSEEEIASIGSENICIICGYKDCNCKYSQGRPSLYFQTIEFGTNLPQTTTFAKVFEEKIRKEESSSSGLDDAKKQPSSTSVNMEKLKTISLKRQVEKPIIKDCKNKFMVTPAQKAKSIIKKNINLVIQEGSYGVPQVTRYPDKRPILLPSEDQESYGSQSGSSDDSTVVHVLEPWYCTEKPKEEEPEITYGRIL